MEVENLSTLNAILNGLSFIMLTMGFIKIKAGNKIDHKKFMISALFISVTFLISYLIYHYNVGSVPYPYTDWTRPLYFIILIPHVILAALNVPFIITLVYFAFKGKFVNHKKLARWVWPVWMYVSVTGVIIYFMLYIL
jgi:putative membrane protein